MRRATKKEMRSDIEKLFEKYGEWANWLIVHLACIKTENAAMYPNDQEYARELMRWKREVRAAIRQRRIVQLGMPIKSKLEPKSFEKLITITDAIRARSLGIRLE